MSRWLWQVKLSIVSYLFLLFFCFCCSFLDLNRSVHDYSCSFLFYVFLKNDLLQEEATYLCSADRAISMCQCSKVRVQHGSFPPHIVKNTFLSTSNRSKVSLMFFTFFGGAHPPLPSPTQQQSNGNKLCSMLDFVPHPHKQGSSAIAFK